MVEPTRFHAKSIGARNRETQRQKVANKLFFEAIWARFWKEIWTKNGKQLQKVRIIFLLEILMHFGATAGSLGGIGEALTAELTWGGSGGEA